MKKLKEKIIKLCKNIQNSIESDNYINIFANHDHLFYYKFHIENVNKFFVNSEDTDQNITRKFYLEKADLYDEIYHEIFTNINKYHEKFIEPDNIETNSDEHKQILINTIENVLKLNAKEIEDGLKNNNLELNITETTYLKNIDSIYLEYLIRDNEEDLKKIIQKMKIDFSSDINFKNDKIKKKLSIFLINILNIVMV